VCRAGRASFDATGRRNRRCRCDYYYYYYYYDDDERTIVDVASHAQATIFDAVHRDVSTHPVNYDNCDEKESRH
jgi:hypothetical protein